MHVHVSIHAYVCVYTRAIGAGVRRVRRGHRGDAYVCICTRARVLLTHGRLAQVCDAYDKDITAIFRGAAGSMAPGAQQADTTASLAAINNIPCACRWLAAAPGRVFPRVSTRVSTRVSKRACSASQRVCTRVSHACVAFAAGACRWLFFAKQLNAAVTFPHGPLAELFGGFSLPRTFDCPKDPRSGAYRCGFASLAHPLSIPGLVLTTKSFASSSFFVEQALDPWGGHWWNQEHVLDKAGYDAAEESMRKDKEEAKAAGGEVGDECEREQTRLHITCVYVNACVYV